MKQKRNAGRRLKEVVLCIGLAVFFVCSTMPATVSFGQRKVKGEWVLPKHYPNGFDGYGRIHRLAEDEVVIDDELMKLSPSVLYYTPTITTFASASGFSVGDLVGYLMNPQDEIVSLWLVKMGK